MKNEEFSLGKLWLWYMCTPEEMPGRQLEIQDWNLIKRFELVIGSHQYVDGK